MECRVNDEYIHDSLTVLHILLIDIQYVHILQKNNSL